MSQVNQIPSKTTREDCLPGSFPAAAVVVSTKYSLGIYYQGLLCVTQGSKTRMGESLCPQDPPSWMSDGEKEVGQGQHSELMGLEQVA